MARRRGRRRRSSPKSGLHGALSQFGGILKGIARRPLSRVVAPSLAIVGLLQLLTVPLSNGDSWLGRLANGLNSGGKNIFGFDNAQTFSGNNVFSILAIQIQANLQNAIPSFVGAALAAIVGRMFKI